MPSHDVRVDIQRDIGFSWPSGFQPPLKYDTCRNRKPGDQVLDKVLL